MMFLSLAFLVFALYLSKLQTIYVHASYLRHNASMHILDCNMIFQNARLVLRTHRKDFIV